MTGAFCVDPPLKKAAIITPTGCAPYGGRLWTQIKSGPVVRNEAALQCL